MPRQFTGSEIGRMDERLTRRLSTDRYLGVYTDDRKVVILRRRDGFDVMLVVDRGGDSYQLIEQAKANHANGAAEKANEFLKRV